MNGQLTTARWITSAAEQNAAELLHFVPELSRSDDALERVCDLADSLLAEDVPHVLPTRMSSALTEWFEHRITRGLALAVAVMAVRAEIIRPLDGEDVAVMRDRVFNRLTAICPTEQIAAAQAVQQVGGPATTGLPYWMDAALRSDDDVCEHIIGEARARAASTPPGRRWFQGPADLGWVVFASADVGREPLLSRPPAN